MYDYILGYAIALEDAFGDRFMAERYRWLRQTTRAAVKQYFWIEDKKLFADNFEQTEFSEHAQILAILSGIPGENALFETGQTMARATYYFSHYYFEFCRQSKRMDCLMKRFDTIADGIKHYQLLTTPEGPGNTRSDCHAWSSGSLFHFYGTIAGIRPAAPGFAQAVITRQLFDLRQVQGTMPHPQGKIDFDFRQTPSGKITGEVTLPGEVTGRLDINGQILTLSPGQNKF